MPHQALAATSAATDAQLNAEQLNAEQSSTKPSAEQVLLSSIRLPEGFEIEVLHSRFKNYRQMALTDSGWLYVGSRKEGKVFYLPLPGSEAEKRGIAGEINMKFTMPSGIAHKDGKLYIADVGNLYRVDMADSPGKALPTLMFDKLPKDLHHGWKYLKFGPDGRLYIPIGAPCNICDAGSDYSKIISLDVNLDSANLDSPDLDMRDEALGVRNSVGFDFHPTTGELWFTDNGRDMMGDDMPSDELNRLSKRGQHFGYPYIHQGDTPDPEFGAGKRIEDYVRPEAKLGAHVAGLGMTFYTGKQFPQKYQGGIFIAEHGSWNRSSKVGYRIRFASLDGNRVKSLETFADGWLQGENVTGRPADVMMLPDGSLLVSDDGYDRIYRIVYRPEN
ncbi:PQQ-dependent sugar dehydrogenase [Shewanella sp. JM162201]|uniref:PQQ-dependent sugar dehydrogenase n=2 Tax=Shewanella jiangmenensis TaxID=2837387 RepID=A0ABS5UZ07_9GAMM|nr:PQQ-dependent sugar dehydrogenase [Shewanella jiangmenensis]